MSDIEDRQNAGTDAGPEAHIPACDLARRRIAAILRRERPMQDQEWPRLRLSEHLCRMYETIPDRYGAVLMRGRWVTGFNVLGSVQPHRIVKFRVRAPQSWKNAANMQSRFVRLPFPPSLTT